MKKGEKTLLISVLISIPGPIMSLVSVFQSSSTTQLADFVRRISELAAMVVSLVIFHIVHNEKKEISSETKNKKEANANLLVASFMILAFIGMVIATTLGINSSNTTGNVLFGLIIAALGLVANTILFIRYMVLAKRENDSILHTQGLLYRAKVLVDLVVTIVLIMVLTMPNAEITHYFDIIGSYLVSLYILYSAIKILLKIRRKKSD